jgi:hypothetical protein
VYFILTLAVVFVLGLLIGFGLVATSGDAVSDPANRKAVEMFGNVMGTMIGSTIGSTLIASIYYELRQIKEGIGPEALASVFD